MTALESRFAKLEESLGSRRRDLVRQILEHPEDTYFLTSRALAKFYGVDTATIVRTIQALGYERYADFAADLRAHFLSRITPYTLMKSAARDKRSIADHVEHSLELDAHNLQALRASLPPDEILKMARIVDRARRVLVVGVDFAAALAHMLAYALVSIGMDAETPVGSTGNLHQKVLVLGPKDILIALSFGRCLQDTVDAVICAGDNGVPTFGITDSDQSPIARFCDHSWNTSVASPAFHESYVAPVAAIDALLVACAQLRPERSLANLQRKEQKFRNRWYSPNRGDERKSKNSKVE
jgi:DNA-binding MurR/RpiR family transcriptional regulator